jgi:lipopolysaccharide transport system ATP-binding protein
MTILAVKNLGKAYRTYSSEWVRIARWFAIPMKPKNESWVLQHVNLNVWPGEAVAIVGHNGAGKSTLLKLITGTLKPTTGTVHVGGRIAAILELGMGFNPDLTGRQNVYHSAGLMGFSADEISNVIDEIEEFAEIGSYFDEPVRTYSSGMQVRVAFAVATAYRPEILIIDEALSVGDSYFQHKSFARIRSFREEGTTLLVVSHDPTTVKLLCDRAILLDQGIAVKEGGPEEVMDYYNVLVAQKENSTITQSFNEGRSQTISGTGEVVFSNISLHNSNGESIKIAKVGEQVELRFTVKVNESVDSLVLGCGITDRLGQMMFGTNTWHTKQIIDNVSKDEVYLYSVKFLANLGVGSYAVHCSLVENDTHMHKNFEWRDGTLIFDVVNVDKEYFVGCMWNHMNFEIKKLQSS